MRATAWIPIVVLSALVAGLSAFLLTSPEPRHRTSDQELGFVRLTQPEIQRLARRAAEHHEQVALQLQTRLGAQRAARAWLDGVVGSAGDRSRLPKHVRVAPTAPAQRRNVAAFTEWADDLPSSIWKTTVRPATVTGDRASGTVTVPAHIELTVFQSGARTRSQRVSAVLTLVPVGGAQNAAPTGWKLAGIRVGGASTWLRSYADPVVLRRTSVDVIAPASRRVEALAIADHARSVLPYLRARYEGVAAADVAAVWLVEDERRAAAAFGAAAIPKTRPDAGSDAYGWVDERGEVVLDWSRLQRRTSAARLAVVRHQLAHLMMRPIASATPAVLIEGVAIAEEVDHPAATAASTPDLRPLDAGFQAGTVDLAALLTSTTRPLAQGRSAPDLQIAGLAGYATVAWIEDTFNHDRLVSLLRQSADGVAIERALRNVLRRDLSSTEQQVAAWVDASLAPTAATDNQIEERP